jgi:hypothetical protein
MGPTRYPPVSFRSWSFACAADAAPKTSAAAKANFAVLSMGISPLFSSLYGDNEVRIFSFPNITDR